jgi:Flp pilus assembly protein TadD
MDDSATKTRVKPERRVRQEKLIAFFLLLLTLIVYAQSPSFDFINIDDGAYVFNNPHVLSGLTLPGLRWAFTTFTEANWHPLTWVSLMADAEATKWVAAFGLEVGNERAGVYHLTNVVLHAANSILVFLLLRSMTGMRWRSAFVAALFAVHPLHVESVAWVTERKDVLSTLFWLLTMRAYAGYVARPSRKGMAVTVVLYALGLMAKPMLVTLPVVLLLMDFWPLSRGKGIGNREQGTTNTRQPTPVTFLLEKAPLLALTLCSCALTFWAQRVGGAVVSFDRWPLLHRLDNAIVSYGAYIMKMFWPVDLGIIYPMRLLIPRREVALGAVFLVMVTVIAVRLARRASLRWFAVGWLWYLVTMAPVIGLVQVGAQAMADRYTYVPLIGPFIIIAWGMPTLVDRLIRRPAARAAVLGASGVAVVLVLSAMAHIQASYWHSNISLFARTLEVTRDNVYIEFDLGAVLDDAGRTEEAIPHFARAVKLRPRYMEAWGRLGTALARLGKFEQAEGPLRMAVALDPRSHEMRNNLGAVLLPQGRVREAIAQFEEALRIKPDYDGAWANLENARTMTGGSTY